MDRADDRGWVGCVTQDHRHLGFGHLQVGGGVPEVCVIGVPSEKWGETIKALVVLGVDEKPSAEMEVDLIRWCKQRLAGYKAPTSVEFRTELPRTATGKLQKFKLRAPYWDSLGRQVN